MICAYAGCSEGSASTSEHLSLSYFKIPNDHRRQVWIKHSQQTNFYKSSRFCEKHFYLRDIKEMGTKKCLKNNAIPISSPTVCKCTESIVDQECFKLMNSIISLRRRPSNTTSMLITLPNAAREVQNNAPHLFSMSTTETNTANNGRPEGGVKLKSEVIPHRSDLQKISEITMIDKILQPTKQKTSLKRKIVHNLLDGASEKKNNPPAQYTNKRTSKVSKSSMNNGNQMRITSDDKKIECLEAVVNYTSQMQTIVKQKGGLDFIIKANSQLIRLLDKVVYEWFQRAQRRVEIGVITDQSFIQVALEAKQIFCIQNCCADKEWLNKFKIKYNITDLDMRKLHVENKSKPPPPVNVYDIVLHVLEKNPIKEYFSNSSFNDNTISENDSNIEIKTHYDILPKSENDIETLVKTEQIDRPDEDKDMEVQTAISNDDQARLHLKPLAEYVLLKDNFRAIGLISQLMDIFSAEIKKEEEA